MKEWWHNLSLREKQTLTLGILAVIIFLIYALIFAPLDNKATSLRNKIKHNQELLSWMQKTDQQIKSAEKTLQKKSTDINTGSLLTIVQQQINKTPLVSNLAQLRQADNDSVQLSFTNVDFDKLVVWLTALWQEHGLMVSQMTTTAGTPPGIVTADLILKNG